MRWFDYLACIWFAFAIWTNIYTGNIFGLTIQVFAYIVYEDARKEIVNGKNRTRDN